MQAIADEAMINTTLIKGCVSPLQFLIDLDCSQDVSMIEPRLYEQDICLWAEKTAKLLRAHRWQEIDLENLIDEVEDLSRRERDKLLSTLRLLLIHLLKWQYQPQLRGKWEITIKHCRREIPEQIEDTPSLRRFLDNDSVHPPQTISRTQSANFIRSATELLDRSV